MEDDEDDGVEASVELELCTVIGTVLEDELAVVDEVLATDSNDVD